MFLVCLLMETLTRTVRMCLLYVFILLIKIHLRQKQFLALLRMNGSNHSKSWLLNVTRKHSSRMRTTRLETVRASNSSGHHQTSLWGRVCLQVNKFEQVFIDHYQMSLTGRGRSPGLMSRKWEVVPLPCDLSHDAFDVTYPSSIPPIPLLWTDRHLWKHYLPTTSFAAGKMRITKVFNFLHCNHTWNKEQEQFFSSFP